MYFTFTARVFFLRGLQIVGPSKQKLNRLTTPPHRPPCLSYHNTNIDSIRPFENNMMANRLVIALDYGTTFTGTRPWSVRCRE